MIKYVSLHQNFLPYITIYSKIQHSRTSKKGSPPKFPSRGKPLFGHGDALLSKAPEEVFTSPAKLEDYASSLTPALGDDFISVARFFSSDRDLELLSHIRSDFSFRPHPEHPLPSHILDALSALVRTQAGRILDHA